LISLGGSLLLWFACAAAMQPVHWTLAGALALNAAVFAVMLPAGARYRTDAMVKAVTRPSDIAWRALAVAACVALVTVASHSIGSVASGMFAVFPVVISSLLVILHMRLGGPAAASVAAHVQAPLIGLSLGFVAVSALAESAGVWWAFLAGLAICLAWNGALLFWRKHAGDLLIRRPRFPFGRPREGGDP
jgi:hypothetical protein